MSNTKTAIIDYGAGNMFSIGAACRRFGYDITVTSDPTVIKSSDRVIFPGVGNAASAREALDRSQLADLIPQLRMPVLGICLGMQMMTRRSDEDDTTGLSIFSCDVREFNSEAAACFAMGGNSVIQSSQRSRSGDSVSADEPHSGSLSQSSQRSRSGDSVSADEPQSGPLPQSNRRSRSGDSVPGKNELLKVPHMGWNRISDLKGPLFKDIDEGSWLYFVHSYYAPICDQSAAVTPYGIPFSAALWNDNFFGCQFHPEKSGESGIMILKNFLEL